MSKRVVVTGMGLVSGIGNNLEQTWDSLISSKSGIGDITWLNTRHKNNLPVSEVKLSSDELVGLAGLTSKNGYSRSSLLGTVAAREAVRNAGIKNINEYRTGIVSATSVGGMEKSEVFFADFLKDNTKGELRNIVTHDCGDTTEKIADSLGIKQYMTTISTACSSSANSIMFGARLIKHNILDRVIVGGTDSLTKFTLNGFNTLMILDKDHCRPFDDTRTGLNLGEGAGFLVLESEETAGSKEIFGEITGYANANEAFHQTASSPEGDGAYQAMKKALEVSGLSIEDIDYINVHGTGTLNNDLSEGRAMERLFNSKVPLFSSTKAFTGHTLGACGGIEAIFSFLSIKYNTIFPNLNFGTQMKELTVSPVDKLKRNVAIDHVLSNSFGFGGNNSSLILSRYRQR
ncbi:MAG TPA: beta-ketoacyl-[acyl-carrier-protein] synthase family protein [Cytophagales bacterium]|nr:beta-ketoacyl-[acyl-carrier-protein] synthase family protein [Cytophagales bacterium]